MDGRPAVAWRSSSSSKGVNCVELAMTSTTVLIRDSKHHSGQCLTFGFGSWQTGLATLSAMDESYRQLSTVRYL